MRFTPKMVLKILIGVWLLIICAAIVLLFFALAGCSTVPVPHDVNMVVKTDCHPDKIAAPQWATAQMKDTDDIFVQANLLLAERRQRMDYEKLLEAANEACQ